MIMKKKIVIGMLAVSALMLAACGNGSSTPPENATSASAEQSASGEKKTNDKIITDSDSASSGEAKEDVSHKTVRVVEPMAVKTDLNHLSGEYPVAFSTSDIKQDDDGVTVHLTVYEQELFDAKDIQALEKNDTIVLDGKNISIISVEKTSDGAYTFQDKDGEEYTLAASKDGSSYYELGVSDSLNYISVGEVDLPLAVNFIYKDQSDLNEKGRTATEEDFKEIAEEKQTTFTEADTTATVKDGEITVINKSYRP